MQWRARVLAPVVAGILGVTGGVATATIVGHDRARTTAFADPLGLGVPLQNLACDPTKAILVVGHGDGLAALNGGVATNTGVHYLETAASCSTQLNAEEATKKPEYVAYLGPYGDLTEPCQLRMQAAHSTDYVARLREGSTQLVKCPCVLSYLAAPTLEREPKPTAYDNVWARSLQGMLHDDDPTAFTRKDISGTYDEFTRLYILKNFQVPSGYLGRNGLMDSTTWKIVTQRICPSYTY